MSDKENRLYAVILLCLCALLAQTIGWICPTDEDFLVRNDSFDQLILIIIIIIIIIINHLRKKIENCERKFRLRAMGINTCKTQGEIDATIQLLT